MASIVWPTSLPQKPRLDGYQWQPQDNRVVFQPEVGPAIERRRSSAVVTQYQMKFPLMTSAQIAAFESWFQGDLKAGSLRYIWADPVNGSYYKWQITEYSVSWAPNAKFELTMKANRLPGVVTNRAKGLGIATAVGASTAASVGSAAGTGAAAATGTTA